MQKKVKKKNTKNNDRVKSIQEKFDKKYEKWQGNHLNIIDNEKNYHRNVQKKHQNQSMNAEETKRILNEFNEQRKETNFLRKYDHSANKYKEDVKSDNFKRHIIHKHNQQNF